MNEDYSRRAVVGTLGVAVTTGLAGCGGGGEEPTATDTEMGTGSEMGTDSEMDTGSQFSYTFSDSDDVVGSSLTAIRVDYPDGSGAVSDATVETATLGGADVTGDLDETSTSNDGSTLTLAFGGSLSLASGEELAMTLANVAAPSGSYTVSVTVNPQSGQTTFEQQF